MNDLQKAYYRSPVGIIEIAGTEEYITSVDFVDAVGMTEEIPECLRECYSQLDEYFKGERKEFTVKLKLGGTDFQRKVWNELLNIPYGNTASYGDIAERIGNKKAVRAVGSANSKNVVAIIVPCHRVIGSNGTLTGYAGGLWRKEWLLEHESAGSKHK